MTSAFFGNFDLASLALWLFWAFFALLIFYIQRENMREGYPLENDDGTEAANQGPFPLPEPKTFKLPHGRGEVTVPNDQKEARDVALAQSSKANGYPFDPTGDPMLDGVGPASWAPRRDVPELDGHGHLKIVPMGANGSFQVAAGRDPRGMTVTSRDDQVIGKITDMWIDAPEQLVRYLEFDLDPSMGEGKRLVPITMVRIRRNTVKVHSINAEHFAAVPKHASDMQVTLLEEEKISAYYGGGVLYATSNAAEPLFA